MMDTRGLGKILYQAAGVKKSIEQGLDMYVFRVGNVFPTLENIEKTR